MQNAFEVVKKNCDNNAGIVFERDDQYYFVINEEMSGELNDELIDKYYGGHDKNIKIWLAYGDEYFNTISIKKAHIENIDVDLYNVLVEYSGLNCYSE